MSNDPDLPTSAPSRRRGRPPKKPQVQINLAPPQESVVIEQAIQPDPPSQQGPAVPFPIIKDDEVDLREKIAPSPDRVEQSSGSDSKVRGASEALPPLEAGAVPHPNPALPEQFKIQAPPPPPAVPVSMQAWVPIQSNDVVQVINNENKMYGTLFTVGDVRSHRVHGYQLMAGGKHEYITVNEDECFRIGSSKVRSRNSCSQKWLNENR